MSDPINKTEESFSSRLTQLHQLLEHAGVAYQISAQPETVLTAKDGVEQGIGQLADLAPTLILETEQGYLAAVISAETRLVYKKIKQELGVKNVALARPDRVSEVTGAEVGFVSLINPGLRTIVDSRLLDKGSIFGGCGIPRYTLQIHPRDLVAITGARVFDFTVAK